MGSDDDIVAGEADPGASPNTPPAHTNRLRKWIAELRFRRQWYRFDSDIRAATDAKDNEESKLPAGESIHLAGFWLTELYLPSSIESLRRGIDAMGWRRGKMEDGDVVEWIDQQRSATGSWRSLGFVTSVDHPAFMAHRTAKLPPGIRATFPSLHASSGLSAMTALFLLDDSCSDELNNILRRDIEGRKEDLQPHYMFGNSLKSRIGRLAWKLLPHWFFVHSTSLYSARLDRPKAVQDYLRAHRQACSDWMADRFPGAFSEGEWRSELPSVELFVSDSERPLDQSSGSVAAFEAVGLARRLQVWESPEWPAIRLALPDFAGRAGPSSLTIACKRDESFEPGQGYGDDRDDWSIAMYAEHRVQGLAFRWAMVQLLITYRRRLASMRDVVSRDARKRTTMRDLKRIRSILSTDAVDLEVAAREIRHLAQNDILFRSEFMTFVEVKPGYAKPDREPASLVDWWRQGLQETPNDLVEEMRILVGSLAATSNVKSAMSSIALQRLVIALTVVSIAIATWAAVHTTNSLEHHRDPHHHHHSPCE